MKNTSSVDSENKKNKKYSKTISSAKSRVKSVPKAKPIIIIIFSLIFAGLGTWALRASFAASNVSLNATSASGSQSLGSNFTVNIRENSGTDAVNAVQADVTYDPAKLQFVSIDYTNSAFDLEGYSNSSGSGIVNIARAKSVTPVTGDKLVAVITFKAIGIGSTSVGFANSSAIISAGPSANILTNTNAFTYSIVDTSAPTRPAGLAVVNRTVNSVNISWNATTDNVAVTGYKLYRNGTLVNGNISGTNFNDIGLTPNTSYSYTVSAFDVAGNESSQSVALATSTLPDTTAPTVPAGLTAGTRTVNSVSISWSASTDNVAVSGYNVYRNGTKITTTTSTNYNVTGLSANTNYTFAVSAYDAAGNTSANSANLNASTLADTQAPTTPASLTSTSKTTNSISLKWNASTDNIGVTGYNILRNGVKIATTAGTTYTDTGLSQATSYTYTVSAYDGAGNTSGTSNSLSVTTSSKPGDINGDGLVNIIDLSILGTNYGKSGKTLSEGDLNGDGTVNIIDLSILGTNWGS